MAKSLFNKAVEDAALSISLRQDGSRSFKGTRLHRFL